MAGPPQCAMKGPSDQSHCIPHYKYSIRGVPSVYQNATPIDCHCLRIRDLVEELRSSPYSTFPVHMPLIGAAIVANGGDDGEGLAGTLTPKDDSTPIVSISLLTSVSGLDQNENSLITLDDAATGSIQGLTESERPLNATQSYPKLSQTIIGVISR